MSEPLAGLIARSLGVAVGDVAVEVVRHDAHVDVERVRFRAGGADRSLVIKRLPRGRDLEAHLLPLLARKSEHVPRVHARGIPPPAVPARRWLLLEDTTDAPGGCEADPREIVAAKVAIEHAVGRDVPALRALGVPELPPAAIAALAREAGEPAGAVAEAEEAARRLASWPVRLVHGDLACASTSLVEQRVVIGDWRWAHLGCALLDVVRLTGDLVARGEAVLGIGLSRVYGALAERTIGTDELRAAELLDRLVGRHLRDSTD